MSTLLGPLYHWSPRERLGSIRRRGLEPGKRNVLQAEPARRAKMPTETWEYERFDEEGREVSLEEAVALFRQRSVCFGTSPMMAWELSHGAWRTTGTMDLWEVWIDPADEVRVLPNFGASITEVRIYNRIPKRRLIWVAERTVTNPRDRKGHP